MEDDDLRFNRRKEFLKKYNENVLKILFPNLEFGMIESWFSDPTEKEDIKIYASKIFSNYKDSLYCYKGENLFIHYTSFENAINILNDLTIRMYDLNNMSDPSEFSFLYNDIFSEIETDKLNELKKQIFSFSLCKYDEKSNPDSFEMWRLYGRDGNGIGLVFSIDEERDDWNSYLLSNILYGENYKSKVIELKNKHESFQSENMDKYKIVNFDNFIFTIAGLHKNNIYCNENEIRLLYIDDSIKELGYQNHNDYSICETFNMGKGTIFYYKQRIYSPLYDERYSENERKDFINRPKIRLKKVILGYRYKESYNNLSMFFYDLVRKRNGNESIPIVLTPIAKNF